MKTIQAQLVVIIGVCVIGTHSSRGEESSTGGTGSAVVHAFENVAHAVEAAKNQFDSVKASGSFSIRTRIISGATAGNASRGEASNSDARYDVEFLCRNFGLYRRIIAIPEAGASEGYRLPTRLSLTPNHVLDGADLTKGYVRAANTDDDVIGDFLNAFWLPGEHPSDMVPTEESLAAWTLKDALPDRARLAGEWGKIRVVLEFDPATSLPTLYDVLQDEESVRRREWEWGKVSGFPFPQRVGSETRLVYPGQVVERQWSDLQFTSVELLAGLNDDEFGLGALGVKPGTIVFDMRDPAQPRYEFQPTSNAVDGLVKIAPPLGATPAAESPGWGWFLWMLVVNVVVILFLAGLFLRSKFGRT